MLEAAAFSLVLMSLQTAPPDILPTLERFVKATIAYDVKTLESLTTDTFLEISPLGDVDPREKFLRFYERAPDQTDAPNRFTITELICRYPKVDLAVAVYRLAFKKGAGKGTREIAFRVTTVLERQSGQWRLMSNHTTFLNPKD